MRKVDAHFKLLIRSALDLYGSITQLIMTPNSFAWGIKKTN